MQPYQLSRFLAMLWAIGSALPGELCTASKRLADRELFEAQHTAKVALEPELNAAIKNPEITKIVLTNDIIVMSDILVNRQEALTLDLNGYKIASLRANSSAIDLQTGNLTITGQGSIVANGVGASGVRIKGAMTAENIRYASLTLDEQVTLYAPHAYGIYLAPNFQAAYGVEITFKGKIVAHDGIGISRLVQGKGEHAPKLTIGDGATIEVDTDAGVALSAAGYGEWQIGAATLTGATGVSVKSGHLNFINTKITATGELANPSGWDNSVGVGAVVQVAEGSEYAGDIRLTFDGGTYISHQSYLVAKYGTAHTLQELTIKSGTFQVPSGVFYGIAPSEGESDPIVTVFGGAFSIPSATELTDYLAKGFYLETNRRAGVTTVIDPNPPAAKLDPVEQLALECTALENLIARAKNYLNKDYAGNELGEWQELTNKAVSAIKRAIKASEKLLQGSKEVALDQVLHLQKRLKTTIQGIESIADEMRGEMLSVLTTAQELDPREYSAYSYNALKEAIIAALALTAQPEASLNQLYSVFCDLQLNIDLLEDPEDETDFALPIPDAPPVLTPAPTLAMIAEQPSQAYTEAQLTPIEERNFMELGASAILALLDQDDFEPDIEPAESSLAPLESVTTIETEVATVDETMVAATIMPEPVDELAIAALNDARSSLQLMIEAVRDLALKDYQAEHAEQFGELQVAIVKAEAILNKPEAVLPEILDVMDEVKFATAGLEFETVSESVTTQPAPAETIALAPATTKRHTRLGTIALAAPSRSTQSDTDTVDWSALREVVADIARLNSADYTSATYANVLRNLERAKTLLATPEATQIDADDLVFDLNLSLLALERNVQAPVSQQFTQADDISTSAPTPNQADVFADSSVTPNLLMSMMAGAYAGLATYRKSRLAAKKRKSSRKIQLFSKA